MTLPACLPVGELAIAIIALGAVETQTKGLVAMLELQVAHGFCEHGDLVVVFEPGLHFATAFFAVALAAFTFAFAVAGNRWLCARLQESVHVCAYARHFTQCLI